MSEIDIDQVVAFVEQFGAPVFPCVPNGKAPATKVGFKAATRDLETIRRWHAERPGMNWAMPTGSISGFDVLDVDVKAGKPGDESLRQLETRHGQLPDTPIVLTPTGGFHYYFRRVNGTAIPSSVDKLGVGLDLRADGAYVVIPPSTINGKTYQFEASSDPSEVPFAEMPRWLIELTAKKPERAISKGGRNTALTSLAGVLRREGMGYETLVAALLTENAARCDPPLPAEEVRKIAASVARYPAPETESSEWPAPLNLTTLHHTEPQPPRHVINPWLPAEEVALFSGHGGSGKSQIALSLAVHISGGLDWCGCAVTRRPVTYISAEDSAEILHWRLSRVCAHLGVSMEELAGLRIIDASHIEAELMRDMPYGEVALTGMYEALAKIVDPSSVLILDGTSDLYGASEIVRRHVRRFVRALRRLVNRDGAVLLLAHIDKAAARDGSTSDRYSGSTAWHNSVRARWSLTTDEDGTGLTLALAKANLAQAGAEVRFRWSPEAHLYVAEATSEGGIVGAIRERQEREGILAALQASVAPVPAAATGQRTAWHVLSARPELPASLRDGREGKRRFWRLIEQMRQMGTICESSIRRSNRHNLATLEAADIGSAPNAPNA